MLEEFKNINMLKKSFKPYVLEEIKVLSRSNNNSIESEISNLDQEQRLNYRNHIFRNFNQMIEKFKEPQAYIEIQKCMKILTLLANYDTFISQEIFSSVVNFASKINSLEDYVFLFKVSSFMQNPSLVSQYFGKEKENIHFFIDKFSKPFSQSYYIYWSYIIKSSQENCDELIFYGIVDKFSTGFFESIKTGQDFSQYWIPSLQLLNEIAKNCSIDINIFIAISDICFIFFDDRYSPDIVLPSVECLITITSRLITVISKIEDELKSDERLITKNENKHSVNCKKAFLNNLIEQTIIFFSNISEYLHFFDKILCGNEILDQVKPIMNLIANISTKFVEIDLYKNGFVQHLIDISSNWNRDEFEPVFLFLFMILTFNLRYYPKLIIEISKSTLLNLAVFYFNDGSCFIKNEILLFFSRLCDVFFWEYVSDFFEENSEIVSSLFLMLTSNISQKSRLIIINALTSLAINIKEKEKFMPNMISQYKLQTSIDAFQEVQEINDESILSECSRLNQAVNNLIQDSQ